MKHLLLLNLSLFEIIASVVFIVIIYLLFLKFFGKKSK